MGEFSISHVLILTLILLIFFGPSRLPALGQSIGKAIRGFKDGMNEAQNEMNKPAHPNEAQASQDQLSHQTQQSMNQKQEDKSRQDS